MFKLTVFRNPYLFKVQENYNFAFISVNLIRWHGKYFLPQIIASLPLWSCLQSSEYIRTGTVYDISRKWKIHWQCQLFHKYCQVRYAVLFPFLNLIIEKAIPCSLLFFSTLTRYIAGSETNKKVEHSSPSATRHSMYL